MSARLFLHALLCSGRPEDCELLDKAHEAVRREVLREAAEKIRASAPCYGGLHHYDDGECHRTFDAADLIDPDKEES